MAKNPIYNAVKIYRNIVERKEEFNRIELANELGLIEGSITRYIQEINRALADDFETFCIEFDRTKDAYVIRDYKK